MPRTDTPTVQAPASQATREADSHTSALVTDASPQAHARGAAGVRAEQVERCRALIADGLYETEDRLDAAVTYLAARLGTAGDQNS